MKRFIKPAIYTALVLAFAALGINQIVSRENHIQLKEVQLKSTTSELKQIQLEYDQNIKKQDELLHQKNVNEQELEKLRQDNEQKNQRIQELEQQVSIKQQQATVAAAVNPTPVAYAGGGNKDSWLAASGIPRDQWANVDYIVSRESGWNPCAYNPGKSNCGLTAEQVNATQGVGVACGLGQSLPCGKWGANWTDPVQQLRSMNTYVQKYGGWGGAVAYWRNNGHY